MRTESFRYLIELAARFSMTLTGVDVKEAFLQAPLDKPIYVTSPKEWLEDPPDDNHDYVWALTLSVYGLKEAGRVWRDYLKKKLVEKGWKFIISDSCICYK